MSVVLSLILGTGAALAQTTDLMITEYVEGSGNNKALEIYNGTEDVINLGSYTIERYANGTSVPTVIALNAVDLQPGDGFVIGNPSADALLLSYLDQTNANINFNGNDALALVFGGSIVIDSFGRVGEDPGTAWSCNDGSTANATLRRRSSICEGDGLASDAFNPCDEWFFVPIDVFSGLGDHSADCGAVANEVSSWGDLKALYH